MLKLKVDGMTCGGCENRVRKALSYVGGIDKVDVDRAQKLVSVAGTAQANDVVAAIEAVGFSAEKAA